MQEKQSYRYRSDVNYDLADKFKLAAQKAAKSTAHNMNSWGGREITLSRGETCYLFELNGHIYGMVLEDLGTKNRAVDDFFRQARDAGLTLDSKPPYWLAAVDTLMMIFIDMAAAGVMPRVLQARYGVGASEWFEDESHITDYCDGVVYACNEVGCVWGGGETPVKLETIFPDTADLAGAAFGELVAPEPILGQNLKPGNKIILVESPGPQANYISGARRLAESLPAEYLTPLSDGTPFGLALSQPTDVRYIKFIEFLIKRGVKINYIVPITGHGLRKIMRARTPLTYRLRNLAPLSPLFQFMIEGLGLTGKKGAEEAMGGMNLGQGMAIIVEDEKNAMDAMCLGKIQFGIKSWLGGEVEEGPRQVIIENPDPIFGIKDKIVFTEKSMQIRAASH